MCVAFAGVVSASTEEAAKLYKQGRQAERAGDVVRAYLLYSEAAAQDPKHPEYWLRSQALRTRASLKAKPRPMSSDLEQPSALPPDPPPAPDPPTISPEDLDEVRRMKPPPELQAKPGRQTLELRGDAKALFQQAAVAYGLGVVFDVDYQGGQTLHLHIEDANYRAALRTLCAATDSFVVPRSAHLFLVAKDTQPKRAELEPTVAVMVPIPDPVTVQEAQELARAIQQTMEILKFSVDGTRRMVLIKDRLSKVLPARALFEQLAWRKPQVEIELQFLEVDETAFYSYGLLWPNNFPITWIGSDPTGTMQSLARVFFGHTILGLGIANAQAFATLTRTNGHILLDAEMRALDGSTANFHVGDKYPIATGGFLGTQVLGVPPAFNFEDLGLALKIIPHVHGEEEVTLEVTAEFKVLGSQSVNGIPSISTRKFESKVRLREGEWGIIAGLMSTTEAKTVSRFPVLASLPLLGPLFRKTDDNRTGTRVVLLLKPHLLNLPPGEYLTRLLYLGSEGRLRIPL